MSEKHIQCFLIHSNSLIKYWLHYRFIISCETFIYSITFDTVCTCDVEEKKKINFTTHFSFYPHFVILLEIKTISVCVKSDFWCLSIFIWNRKFKFNLSMLLSDRRFTCIVFTDFLYYYDSDNGWWDGF